MDVSDVHLILISLPTNHGGTGVPLSLSPALPLTPSTSQCLACHSTGNVCALA